MKGIKIRGIDGFGYLYGTYEKNGVQYKIDIMPPWGQWTGQLKPDPPPHDTDWVVYIDGEEIARVRKAQQLGNAIGRSLPKK